MPSRIPRRQGAALIITLSMIAMMTFLVVAFFSRSLSNLQVETASTGTIRADLLARSAGEVIVSDFRTEIIAGSTVSGSGSQQPIYTPLAPNTAVTPAVFPSQPSVSRYGSLPTYDATFYNLVKQSSGTGRFFPDVSPYNTNLKPIIQTVTPVTTDMVSPNGRMVVANRWDLPPGPYTVASSPPLYTSGLGPQLLVNAAGIGYSHFYTNSFLPHWIMMTRDGVPALQAMTSIPASWKDYSPTNTDAAIGRFAYNIYNVGGLLDVNAAGYDETAGSLPLAAVGQKGTSALAKLSVIPGITSDANAALFTKTWRNAASGNSSDNYLAYLGFTRNAANALLTGNPLFAKGPGTGFLQTAVSTTASDGHVLGRQDLIRLATKLNAPYGLNATSLPYLTHFSREVNAPSWTPPADAPVAAYNYRTAKDNANSANRFLPNVRVGPSPTWRRLTGELAVDGEPLIKYRFPLSWLAILQDATPNTTTWDLTPEGIAVVTALDLRNKANGGPGLSGTTTSEKAADMAKRAFGLTWDVTNYRWTYLGSSAAAPLAVAIAVLGDSTTSQPTTVPPTPTPVCRDNREPNFFELLKAGILRGSLGDSSDYESMCVSAGEDASPDYQIMQIGVNIIDQADTDSYPTQIAFGVHYDTPNSIKSPKTVTADGVPASGNPPKTWPIANDPKVFSGVEDLPYIYTFLSTPYRIPAGQDDLNQQLPSPALHAPYTKVQNAKRDMLDCWLQFVMWKPHQPPVTAPATAMKFRIVFTGSSLKLIYLRDNTMFNGVNFYDNNNGVTAPVLTAATVNFDDSTDFRVPTVLGGMGNTNLHNFTCSQDQGKGTTGGAAPMPLPRGMWMGEMYRPEKDPNDAEYMTAPAVVHTEFRGQDDSKIELQYQDGAGAWHTYQRYDRFAVGTGTITNYGGRSLYGYADDIGTLKTMIANNTTYSDWSSPPYYRHLDISNLAISAIDPRSHRYGLLAHYRDYGPTNLTPSMLPNGNWNYFLKEGWTPKAVTPYSMCFGPSSTPARFFPNWTGGPQDNPWQTHTISNCIQDPTSFWVDNTTTINSSQSTPQVPNYYLDMDGIQRRGDGDSVVTPSNNVRPTQLVNTSSTTPPTANTQDLGRVLNRPFRSVGELGYVFRDEPYKSLNLFTNTSADSALLDLFSVTEQPAVVAGKVDLNTKNPEVLQALIVAASREEQSTTNMINAADALTIATKLRDNVKDTSGNANTGPLLNPADIANRLATILPVSSGDPNTTIKARREVVGRALTGSGQTRTWNFLVDIIAQSGRFAPSAITPAQFIVEGEKHYWLHVAIDRYTGQVIDQQLEPVLE